MRKSKMETIATGDPKQPPTSTPPRRRSRLKRLAILFGSLVLLWFVVAYLILPAALRYYAHRHPALDDVPGITHTANGSPGDPLNVALIGTEDELKKIMLAAKWYPADPLTLRSCLRIASASVLKRPYDAAPVSNLYLWGRKQDLAFEQAVGKSPRHRHHVRFWRSAKVDPDGRPIWVGSAIYDKRVGLSRRTGQITHVTEPDIDAERDLLFRDLKETGDLSEVYFMDGFHKILKGKNGGGDPWYTDGRLEVGVIRKDEKP
jgi:hypothetical protein